MLKIFQGYLILSLNHQYPLIFPIIIQNQIYYKKGRKKLSIIIKRSNLYKTKLEWDQANPKAVPQGFVVSEYLIDHPT